MKNKIIFSLLFLQIGFVFAQSNDTNGGTPVKGILPIKRTESTSDEQAEVIKPAPMVNTNPSFDDDGGGSGPIPQLSSLTGNSTEVGVTEGKLSVSLTGGASYTIPVATPPGINGIVPQIALSYNSQGGNGLAGYGWNVSGISTITRIPSTKFHDGVIDGVDFNSLDRFAFDGQRIMVKNGTVGVYGADGTVYETESFSNVQITSYGVHPSGVNFGPAYFKVQYPDGSEAYYGNSITSRSLTDWAIMYWQNPQGIRINYNYSLVSNNLSITSITYGATFANTPINEIQFIYKPRQRPEQSFVGGQSFVSNNILSEIKVKGNGIGFRNYSLVHDATSLGYERIKSITEKSGDGSKSLNPTVFDYETTSNTNLFLTGNPTFLTVSNINFTNSNNISGDFDGDGKTDLILYPTTGSSAKSKYWLFTDLQGSSTNLGYEHNVGAFIDIFPTSWLSWNNKLMPNQGWCTIQYNAANNITTFNNFSTGYPINLQYSRTFEFPKLNIGYTLNPPCSGGGPYPDDPIVAQPILDSLINKASPPPPPTTPTWISVDLDIPKEYVNGDFNGDGLTDVIIIEKPLYYSYNIGGCPASFEYYYYGGGKSFFLNTDRRLTNNYVNESGYVASTLTSKFSVADVNGDGKSDLLVFDSGRVNAYSMNDNNTFIEIINKLDGSIIENKPKYFGDFNGDGKLDFVVPQADNQDSWSFFFSKGNDFQKITTSIGLSYFTSDLGNYDLIGFSPLTKSLNEISFITSDFNGDGKTDIMMQQNLTVEYVDTKRGRDYSNNGKPQITKLVLLENQFTNGTGIGFSLANVVGQFSGIKRYPIPIITNHNQINQNMEYSLMTNNFIKNFQSSKDNKKDIRIKQINLGNGVKEKITYAPLQSICTNTYNCDYPFQASTGNENYPNFDIKSSNSFQVVSQLEKSSFSQTKYQKFKYYGAVTSVNGLGFLGFRGLLRTNWFSNESEIITSVSKHDLTKRSAIYEAYAFVGQTIGNIIDLAPTNFITKSSMTYQDVLLPNKVYKITNPFTKTINGLYGTSTESTSSFDNYNNPLTSTTLTKNNVTIEQTQVTNLQYLPATSSPNYVIGRPSLKSTSVDNNINVMLAEEKYTYNSSQLLSKIEKKGNATNYLSEDNIYDGFGNITKKIIKAVGLAPRETNYTYDISGRFLMTSSNLESQITSYIYNTSNGLLVSQIKPSLPGFTITSTFEYDVWGKKKKDIDYLGNFKTYNYSWTDSGLGGGYFTTITGNDSSASYIYLDDLGRKTSEGMKTINDVSSLESNISWKSLTYDAQDRTIMATEPYFATLPDFSALASSTTAYDIYGRPTQIVEPTGKTTTVNYVGLTSTSSDGIKTVIATKNSIGNVVSMNDNGGTITYQYFANGNLKQTSFGGVNTSIEQDGWGRKTKMTDPSAGEYRYEYNEFGETKKEFTPKGKTEYTIDNFGNVLEKTIIGIGGDTTNLKTTYTYNQATKLLTNTRFEDFNTGYVTNYTYGYDDYKRLNFTDENCPNAYYQRATQFDSFGRPLKELYTAVNSSNGKRSDKWIKNIYKNGGLFKILDDATNQLLWETSSINAKGQLTTGRYGNSISISNTYDDFGFPSVFKHDLETNQTVNVMTLTHSFDEQRANLLFRYNSMFNWTENFEYDTLDRLTKYNDKNGLQVQQTYDSVGRINTNVLGQYNYATEVTPFSTQQPPIFQNTNIELTPTANNFYKNNRPNNLDITYNVFKSPVSIIEEGKDKLSFIYNINNSRSTMYYGGLQTDKFLRPLRKHYSADGSMEIKLNTVTGNVEFTTYIGGDAYSAPVILRSDGTSQQYLYLHRDYQSSIIAITNQAGAVIEKRLFDAWGEISKIQDGSNNNLLALTVLDRGYTGHEHLQSVGLINMNARLYDPMLHRFLQPDNNIQDPFNTLNFNRYAYVLNNPLKYTDPSGEYFWLPIIIGAVIGAYSGGVLANGGELNPVKWEYNTKTLGYIIGGAIVGGITGNISNTIATSGVAFANTKAILVGSIINGMGTHAYTGDSDVILSFGFLSLNITTGEFGYLFKEGNSFMENLGYGLGALANASDILAGSKPGNAQLNTEHSDITGHSALTKVDETDGYNSLVSVGPAKTGKNIFNPFDFSNKSVNWHNYVDVEGTFKTIVKGVNLKSLTKYSSDLANGGKYNLYFSSCVNHTARALTISGVPALGIHPLVLYSQMYLRSLGIRPMLYSYLLQK